MIIIPDVHGRDFWKTAVEGRETEEIVFLGDYLDPYPREKISPEEVIENFKDIIKFKKEHMNNVILLLGNHDFGSYIAPPGKMVTCRTDVKNRSLIHDIFEENKNLFTVGYYKETDNGNYSFMHSVCIVDWVYAVEWCSLISKTQKDNLNTVKKIIEWLNNLWETDNELLFAVLNMASRNRGGRWPTGSPIWADLDEIMWYSSGFTDSYQVFGHSQQMSEPVIMEKWACLDCRRAFELNDNKFTPITPEINLC